LSRTQKSEELKFKRLQGNSSTLGSNFVKVVYDYSFDDDMHKLGSECGMSLVIFEAFNPIDTIKKLEKESFSSLYLVSGWAHLLILSWNVWGLGDSEKRIGVKDFCVT